jgi:hypothetical protein
VANSYQPNFGEIYSTFLFSAFTSFPVKKTRFFYWSANVRGLLLPTKLDFVPVAGCRYSLKKHKELFLKQFRKWGLH